MKRQNTHSKRSKLHNLLWLYAPFLEYAKGYVILTVAFWALILPLHRLLMVIFPETMLTLLQSGKDFGTILLVVFGFQFLLLIIPVFEDFYNAFSRDVSETKVRWKIKKALYQKALKTDYRYVDDPQYYQTYTWAVNHQEEKSMEAFSLINQAISAFMIIASLAALISSFSPWIVLLTVVSMVLRTIGYIQYNRLEVKREADLMRSTRKLDYFHRIFYQKEYSADLKTTRLKDIVLRHFDKTSEQKIRVIRNYAKKSTGWAVFSDIVYRVFMFLIIVCVAYNIMHGQFGDAASYITIMLSIEKMEDSMYQFFELFQRAGKLSLYAEEIQKFYELESTIETENTEGLQMPKDAAVSVDFADLCFQYEHSDFKLDHLNLHIDRGEKIAIVGENGTGKSTLVKLLLRLYDPLQGSILLDQHNLKEYDLRSLRKKVGVVFQNTHIYSLTLQENMELYRDVAPGETASLLSHAQLEKMLEKNQATVDSIMTKEFDDSGIMCSTGEEQKVGWARVLDGQFGLLILDEPSSALDPLAEYEMNQLLYDNRNTATTIVVAHRLSTIRNMDRIVVMHQGRIAEVGTHQQLMDQQGHYYEMFTKQAENYQ